MDTQRFFILLSLLIFAAGACQAQSDIRKVDFKNFTYRPHCAGEETQTLTVKNGEYSMEKQMQDYVDRLYFNIFSVTYGDVDGDKTDEAIVLSTCNTGGTGNFSEGFVYKLQSGRPQLMARISGGDRAYGGLRAANVVDGLLVVERNDPGKDGANCCPELILSQKYKMTNGKLVEVGKATSRPIFPTERVSFDRGASGKTITVIVPANEGKRLLIGARAGQHLTVSAGNTKAQVRLLEDARITEGVNNFVAVLPKSGDYTIEISNQTDDAITVVLNIKIQ
ncbi:MAG: hypothetical protein ACJ72Z_06660 [Pyrinomonadaceae bacterium]